NRHDVRRYVARDRRVVRDERVRTDLAELMNPGEAAHVHPIADLDVPAERRVIREHAMRADHAVVTDVGAGHEKIVVRDTRDELILRRAAVDRAVLAKRVALADLEPSRLALVLQVLRRGADRCELKDMIIAPD